jgi:hypothetical protein
MNSVVTAVQKRALDESGMTTAEYAVGTVATCGAGGLLFKLLTSDSFMDLLRSIFSNALGPFLG